MIDGGAHYGNSLKPFANENWKIFAFEPYKVNRSKLKENFKNYSNVIIDDFAVSDKNKSLTLI